MAKQGMKRPERTHTRPRNQTDPVPELQGKAKHSKQTATPLPAESPVADRKLFHAERPIPEEVYPVLDTDLARDNVENDLPAADRAELS